ncbi:MAG: thermonuclease family protein [Alphaproteobacteria bacterium]|nr:thermonuclease family protein [Alphaproteobacteria bacterium]
MLYNKTKNIKQQSFFDTYSIHFAEETMFKQLLILILILVTVNVQAKELKIIDGDSFLLNGKEIRLEGIDAPEYQQQCYDVDDKPYDCGVLAYKALRRMIKNSVKCKHIKTDRYKRIVAVCYVGDECLNEKMVKDGWAVAYTYYTNDYIDAEKSAKSAKKGIWQGRFMRPDLFRALHRED